MIKRYIILFLILLLIGCTTTDNNLQPASNEVNIMKLISQAFQHNGAIPSKYTCDGANGSPPLKIEGVPANAKSLVLIMDDPDAVRPAGKVWDHWIVFNIPPTTTTIAEGREPRGIHGKGTGGNLNYKGPCPPDAEHRYYFKLYALDRELGLREGATKKEVEQAMEGHVLAKAELMGRYERG